jgi:hypothetical protein
VSGISLPNARFLIDVFINDNLLSELHVAFVVTWELASKSERIQESAFHRGGLTVIDIPGGAEALSNLAVPASLTTISHS